MEARGLGRSGPRRKTGCLTCRRRKVRCDEMKPVCRHCTRLRLKCAYKSALEVSTASTRQRVEKMRVPDAAPYSPDATFFETVLRAEGHSAAEGIFPAITNGYSELPAETAFDINNFIGGITSELQQRQKGLNLNLHHETLTANDEPAASLLVELAATNGASSNGDDGTRQDMNLTLHCVDFNDHTFGVNDSSSPSAGPDQSMVVYEEQLLQHFLLVGAPPVIYAPFDMEWKFVRPAMLALARESHALMNAVCCYADVHKSRMEGRRWTAAPAYYRLASAEVQSSLMEDVGDRALEKVFATVFLLMLAELASTPDLSRPGTSWLHSAYLLLKKFSRKTTSWRGFAQLIVSWISLLDVKSLIAGREGDPLEELGDLSTSVEHNNADPPDKQQASPAEKAVNELFADPTFLVYDAIVGPVFRFFVKAQQVIRRIVRIDLHHRSRGTLTDEFEVLQIAHQVGADLEALWNSRPAVLDVYERPDKLDDTLAPALARQICRIFSQYVANFLTNFIYLHRVAFAIYPRTDRVRGAVDRIIRLASIELDSASENHRGILPDSFLWPLFIAGLEGSVSQRGWIMEQMRRMASHQNGHPIVLTAAAAVDQDQRHPNAAKALLLLEEMTRRQDESKTSADSKCVRRELFRDFFIII
ncbi:hypothetical protein VTN77DRAFT_3831 [Rasamsonia byssochlamydoides]|uniref:uncharacterized protein n=1 Tax=Rasamsonia byssochlamydoides TaxID=89139 RepID=UPI0037448EBB